MIERKHIGFFGKMNAGKSTLMNLLTQQEISIVDEYKGTTADTKITLQEIHGLGPVKLFDTAGFDESETLGLKKREKTISILKQCDLILLTICLWENASFKAEKELLDWAHEYNKKVVILFNRSSCEKNYTIEYWFDQFPGLKFYSNLVVDGNQEKSRPQLIQFIVEESKEVVQPIDLLPFVRSNNFYILNIPMDEETPEGRFLRPQSLCTEYITRSYAWPVPYRMNLQKARSGDNEEKTRFKAFINSFSPNPRMVITDSQAMDIVNQWVPAEIEVTTFSIMMINYGSRGKLDLFYEGLKVLDSLKDGDKVLIAEACNHSRIKEDIGTVQIPKLIKDRFPNVIVEHNFGREFQDNRELERYKLVIHCGGCMISPQALLARINDLNKTCVPITNYGLVLSYFQGLDALDRVMRPWLK